MPLDTGRGRVVRDHGRGHPDPTVGERGCGRPRPYFKVMRIAALVVRAPALSAAVSVVLTSLGAEAA